MIEFLEWFQYPFFLRAVVAAAIVGLVCSVTGVFVVLRGLSFIGAGISHSAFAGVALGLLLGIQPLLSAIVFCVLLALAISYLSRKGKLHEDATIGIFFAGSMALGVVLMSFVPNGQTGAMGYLFGSILTLSVNDVWLTIGAALFVLTPVLMLSRTFMLAVFDEDQAALCGIRASWFLSFLLILLCVSIVIAINVVGVILAMALIVAPAATALQFVRDFDRALLLSGVIGIVVAELGLIVSFACNLPPGATIALLTMVLFTLAVLVRSR